MSGFLTPEEKVGFAFKVSADLSDVTWPEEEKVVVTMNDGLYLDRSRNNWVKPGGKGRYSDHMDTSQVQRGETRWIQVDFGSVLEVAEVIISLFAHPWYMYSRIIMNCAFEFSIKSSYYFRSCQNEAFVIRIGNSGISDGDEPRPQTMIENGNAICHSTKQYEGDYKKDFYAAR